MTQAELLSQSAKNIDNLGTLDLTISDPPTQQEVNDILTRLNELILALQRL